MTKRRPWEDFTNISSTSFVRGLVADARDVLPEELVDMSCHHAPFLVMPAQAGIQISHHTGCHIAGFPRPIASLLGKPYVWHDKSCKGTRIKSEPSIITCLAYAQEELIYNDKNQIVTVDSITYTQTSRAQRVNKFGLAYPRDRKFLLHKTLADIVVGATDYLYQTYNWRTVLYDGLRTVDGAFALYNFATDEDMAAKLLAMPGQSAHNKGLAVDSMMIDENNCEIEMGGHFDHLDMSTNMRHYAGDRISPTAKKNRLIREAAFLRSAFSQGLLVAPLRNEFWDDRLPENREDLWRILDSAARCIGIEYSIENKESWNYTDFLSNWQRIFAGNEAKLIETIGYAMPPLQEKAEFYHGNYHPIYDINL